MRVIITGGSGLIGSALSRSSYPPGLPWPVLNPALSLKRFLGALNHKPPSLAPSEEEAAIAGMLIFFVLFPIAIAYARRVWRRSAKVVMGIPAELSERLNRLEESIDSVAIEVERVGEGQRFVTNLFMEGGPQMLGAGPMNTLEIKERERVEAEQRR